MSNELLSILITQTWQVAILAAVVWLFVKLFAADRPHLAHALWLVVLIKCLTPPVFSSPTSAFSRLGPNRTIENQTANVVQQINKAKSSHSAITTEPIIQYPSPESSDAIVVRAVPEASLLPGQLADPNTPVFTNGETNGKTDAETYEAKSPIAVAARPAAIWKFPIVFVWLSGVMVCLAITLGRFVLFSRWVRKSAQQENARLNETIQDLCEQLNLRRKVRVKLLDRPVGPAVSGLIRPTILLPVSIVKGKSMSELEPLLAHELIHVRRGDLWWALVQTLAQNLFWFHPLVRLANRMLTRESERSCDEETVASLGCSPATYANGLLEVLEHKHRLRVAPALPGVRPVDITSARLERVMNLGNGIHRKTPIWIWLILIACCVTVLPGAALVNGQESSSSLDQQEQQESEQQESSEPQEANAAAKTEPLPMVNDVQPWIIRSYAVSKLEEQWKQSKRFDGSGLEVFLGCYVPGSGGCDPLPENFKDEVVTPSGSIKFGNNRPTMQIADGVLYAYGTVARHGKLAASIDRLGKFGFRSVVVKTKMITIPGDQLEGLGIDWLVAPVAAKGVFLQEENESNIVQPKAKDNPVVNVYAANLIGTDTWSVADSSIRDGDLVRAANDRGIAATSYIQQNTPVLYSMIDSEQVERVYKLVRDNTEMELMQAPTVSLGNGMDASVFSGTQRPFVVGLEDRNVDEKTGESHFLRPFVQIINQGQNLKFNATIVDDEAVRLACRLENTTILKVDTVTLPVKGSEGSTQTLQVPQVATTLVQSSLNVPAGKTLVLSSVLQGNDDKYEMSLVFLTCYLPESDNPDLHPPGNVGSAPGNTGEAPDHSQMRISAGDTLAISIEGVLDNSQQSPPTGGLPNPITLPAGDGFPVQVRQDGTISLPLVDAINVRGKTADEVKQLIFEAYTKGDADNDPLLSTDAEIKVKSIPVDVPLGRVLIHEDEDGKVWAPILPAANSNQSSVPAAALEIQPGDWLAMSIERRRQLANARNAQLKLERVLAGEEAIDSVVGVDIPTAPKIEIKSLEPSPSQIESYYIDDPDSRLYGATVKGNVLIQEEGETTFVQATKMSVKFPDDCSFSGENGKLMVSEDDDWQIELAGSVEASIERGIVMKADNLNFNSKTLTRVLQLDGNVRVKYQKEGESWIASADRASVDGDDRFLLQLTGNVVFHRLGDAERRVTSDALKVDLLSGRRK